MCDNLAVFRFAEILLNSKTELALRAINMTIPGSGIATLKLWRLCKKGAVLGGIIVPPRANGTVNSSEAHELPMEFEAHHPMSPQHRLEYPKREPEKFRADFPSRL